MPQLNPLPWLSILILTWVVFLNILPVLVITFQFPNEATAHLGQTKHNPWTWPWL